MIGAFAWPPHRARVCIVVPGESLRAPPAIKRTHRAKPGARQPEDGDGLIREGAWPRSCVYLSFKVARPISASTTAMIQKRITMVGSFQPSCS